MSENPLARFARHYFGRAPSEDDPRDPTHRPPPPPPLDPEQAPRRFADPKHQELYEAALAAQEAGEALVEAERILARAKVELRRAGGTEDKARAEVQRTIAERRKQNAYTAKSRADSRYSDLSYRINPDQPIEEAPVEDVEGELVDDGDGGMATEPRPM